MKRQVQIFETPIIPAQLLRRSSVTDGPNPVQFRDKIDTPCRKWDDDDQTVFHAASGEKFSNLMNTNERLLERPADKLGEADQSNALANSTAGQEKIAYSPQTQIPFKYINSYTEEILPHAFTSKSVQANATNTMGQPQKTKIGCYNLPPQLLEDQFLLSRPESLVLEPQSRATDLSLPPPPQQLIDSDIEQKPQSGNAAMPPATTSDRQNGGVITQSSLSAQMQNTDETFFKLYRDGPTIVHSEGQDDLQRLDLKHSGSDSMEKELVAENGNDETNSQKGGDRSVLHHALSVTNNIDNQRNDTLSVAKFQIALSTPSGAPQALSMAASASTPLMHLGGGPAVSGTNANIRNIANAISTATHPQNGISVRLSPAEMGHVYIDFSFDGDRNITAVIRGDTPEAMSVLKEQSASLQNLLKDGGFDTISLNFEQSPESESQRKHQRNTDFYLSQKDDDENHTGQDKQNNPAPAVARARSYWSRESSIDLKL